VDKGSVRDPGEGSRTLIRQLMGILSSNYADYTTMPFDSLFSTTATKLCTQSRRECAPVALSLLKCNGGKKQTEREPRRVFGHRHTSHTAIVLMQRSCILLPVQAHSTASLLTPDSDPKDTPYQKQGS
jgi:hypothetical protein